VAFTNGIELSRRFYLEFVKPLISSHFPDLRYSSALIGPGSEVLGYDTAMSTDHDWGPRVFLFLQKEDMDKVDAKAGIDDSRDFRFFSRLQRFSWTTYLHQHSGKVHASARIGIVSGVLHRTMDLYYGRVCVGVDSNGIAFLFCPEIFRRGDHLDRNEGLGWRNF
jgi:hypothetical protein